MLDKWNDQQVKVLCAARVLKYRDRGYGMLSMIEISRQAVPRVPGRSQKDFCQDISDLSLRVLRPAVRARSDIGCSLSRYTFRSAAPSAFESQKIGNIHSRSHRSPHILGSDVSRLDQCSGCSKIRDCVGDVHWRKYLKVPPYSSTTTAQDSC